MNQSCYSQGRRRYTLARWGVWAVMACSGMLIAYETYGLTVLHLNDGTTFQHYSHNLTLTGYLDLALRLLAGGVFVYWWTQQRDQLTKLGALTPYQDTYNASFIQHETGQNIGGVPAQNSAARVALGWFIPFWRWWFPYQYTKEMALDEQGLNPPTMLPWWVCWVLSDLLTSVGSQFITKGLTLADYRTGLAVYIASDLLRIAAGFLLMPVMACIQQRVARLHILNP